MSEVGEERVFLVDAGGSAPDRFFWMSGPYDSEYRGEEVWCIDREFDVFVRCESPPSNGELLVLRCIEVGRPKNRPQALWEVVDE